MLDLKKLENKLDEALKKETKETLTAWLKEKRADQNSIEEICPKFQLLVETFSVISNTILVGEVPGSGSGEFMGQNGIPKAA